MKDFWRMTAKKGEKNTYRIFIHDFESKFETVFLIFFIIILSK